MIEYTFTKSGSGTYVTFHNFDQFCDFVFRYFSAWDSDIAKALTTFKMRPVETENGMHYEFAKNTWRDITTCCYIYKS